MTCQEQGGGGQLLGLGRGAGPGRQKLCCWVEGWGWPGRREVAPAPGDGGPDAGRGGAEAGS